jgi:putative membrane protein
MAPTVDHRTSVCYLPAERREQNRVLRVLVHLVANGLALVLLAQVLPEQVSYATNESIIIFAIILGLLNALLRPLLQLITLPLSCLTLGLFAFVVNAVVFYLAARLSVGVEMTALGALVGSIVVTILTGLLYQVFRRDSS